MAGQVGCEISELNSEMALETALLEGWRGDWNTWCSSEMLDIKWNTSGEGESLDNS